MSLKKFAGAGALAAAVTLGITPLAAAEPPGGGDQNGNVTIQVTGDKTLRANKLGGATIYFKVNDGYSMADGTKVNLKIDDGHGYSDTGTQFTGIVASFVYSSKTTKYSLDGIACTGFANGSGGHWLRAVTKDANGNKFSGKSNADVIYDGSLCTN